MLEAKALISMIVRHFRVVAAQKLDDAILQVTITLK
jgi:hypothetical protein